MANCLICDLPVTDPDAGIFDCRRCGHYEVIYEGATRSLRDSLRDPGPQQRRRANLSHKVRRRTRPGERQVGIPLVELDLWGLDDPLPSPAELLDRLVLWVGDHQPSINQDAEADRLELSAWLGLPLDTGNVLAAIGWLLDQEAVHPLVTRSMRDNAGVGLALKWKGWDRYADLKHREATSFTAFMAMKFGDPQLDAAVEDHFKPAVAATGFTLKRLNDGQGAGLIDDQMRVALRTCRFVLADLTHANLGAYWEAGFGEGLGKPVIYTCRKDVFLDKEKGTHFDTNHLLTVLWDPADLPKAASELKATIRNTLPDVAKMTDD